MDPKVIDISAVVCARTKCTSSNALKSKKIGVHSACMFPGLGVQPSCAPRATISCRIQPCPRKITSFEREGWPCGSLFRRVSAFFPPVVFAARFVAAVNCCLSAPSNLARKKSKWRFRSVTTPKEGPLPCEPCSYFDTAQTNRPTHGHQLHKNYGQT